MTQQADRAPQGFVIPGLIKRNTVYIALSQSFNGGGMQMAYGIGPLMVVALSGSASLAGLSVGLFALSRFLVAYPVGRITDAFGRKPGIFLGLVLALAGCLMTGMAMQWGSLLGLAAGMLVFGMGMNASQQLRVAAADMYPPRMRARALGFVATGSLIGLFIAPLITAAGDIYGPRMGVERLALPWLLLPILIFVSMWVVFLIRPDPKTIGQTLENYYPDYKPAAASGGGAAAGAPFRPTDLLRDVRTRLAIACNAAAQANMSIVMVLTSLILDHHGHSLAIIGLSHAFHSAGMFAFTIPLGWLADRFGREQVMYPGVATTILGAGLVTFAEGFLLVTIGTFLVGIGWAAANVAATAFIADRVSVNHRGRAIGLNDSFAGGAAVVAAVVTGPLIQGYGLGAAGVAAVIFAAAPFAMLLASKLRAR